MMTTSTVSRGGNTRKYFMATEYYCGRNGEPRESSEWQGKGAEALGLAGAVNIEAFDNLLEGFGPDGQKLTVNAGTAARKKQGIDCTNSAPKSVSVLMAHASPEMREKIIDALKSANSASIGYLQDNLTIAGGKGSTEHQKADGVAVATFAHYASRNLDPQAHFHNIVFAAAQREDGSWGAVDQVEVFRHQKAAGAVFRCELAANLNALGFTIENDEKNGFGFTVAGISQETIDHYSTRREEVLKYLKEHGQNAGDAEACQRAAERTKTAKKEPAFADMLKLWELRGKPLGLDAAYIDSLAQGREQHAEIAVDERAILADLTDKMSAFEKKDVVAAVADAASKNGGLSAARILEITDGILTKNAFDLGQQTRKADRIDDPEAQQDALYIGTETPTAKIGQRVITQATRHLYTTPEVLKREIALYSDFKASQDDHRHDRSAGQVEAAIGAYEKEMSGKHGKSVSMKEQQAECLRYVAKSGRQALIVGFSGTGKSFTMGAVRTMEEAAGQRVIATALAGKAASGLKSGAGIESKESGTMASIILSLENGAQGKKGGLIATEKDTFIVDEAGMLGAKQYRRLQELAPNSKIIVLGDDKQFQAIDAGNFFGGLQDKAFSFTKARLTEIERQKLPWHLEAVIALKDGRGAQALDAFREAGLLNFKSDEQAALLDMAADYIDAKHISGDTAKIGQKVAYDDKVCMVSFHKQAKIVNDEIRRVRIERGELGAEAFNVSLRKTEEKREDKVLERELRQGDRIRITKNNKPLGIMNGELGEITNIKRLRGDLELTLKIDGHDKPVSVRLSEYAYLEHGYCATGHSSQGVSVARGFTYLDTQAVNKQAGYVLASRSKYETTLYASAGEAETVEQAFDKLARAMSKNGGKDWSLDYLSERQLAALEKATSGSEADFKAKAKAIEEQYGGRPESAATTKQEPRAIDGKSAGKSASAKPGELINAGTLEKGTTIAVACVELAEADKIIVKEAGTGRRILFENTGVFAATAADEKGQPKSLGASLKDSLLGGQLIVGDKGAAVAFKSKNRTFSAGNSGKLEERAQGERKSVLSLAAIGREAGRGVAR